MSSVLHTTHRAEISNDHRLHNQYTQKTKDVVTIINLISIAYQAERNCNSSMKTT